jgi:inner membrane protein
MDPLTQGVLGGAIAAAGFREKLGRRSVLFAAVAAMSPDLDVLVGLWGDEWTTLAAHRGSSHSLLVLPFVAPLVGWLGWRFFDLHRRRSETGEAGDFWQDPRYRSWTHLAFWALITHPLLDVFTTYGTQLLAPFSRTRFAFDAIAILDPIFTLPLLIAVLVAHWERPGPGRRRGMAVAALVFCAAYIGWGLSVSHGARERARVDLDARGFEIADLRASPVFVFPPIRRVAAHDGRGTFMAGAVSAWNPRAIEWHRLESEWGPEVDAVLATRGGRTFAWFADGWIRAEIERTAEGEGDRTLVRLYDERYGLITRPEFTPFVTVGELNAEGEPIRVEQAERGGLASEGDDGGTDPRTAIDAELEAGNRLLFGDPPQANPSSDPES